MLSVVGGLLVTGAAAAGMKEEAAAGFMTVAEAGVMLGVVGVVSAATEAEAVSTVTEAVAGLCQKAAGAELTTGEGARQVLPWVAE